MINAAGRKFFSKLLDIKKNPRVFSSQQTDGTSCSPTLPPQVPAQEKPGGKEPLTGTVASSWGGLRAQAEIPSS